MRILLLIFLSSPLLLSAQFLTKENIQYLEKHSQQVAADSSLNKPHWNFIDSYIKDKRIVALGEFSHGSKEVFDLRNSLIQYLYENHDFKVVLFESGIGELLLPDQKRKEVSSQKMTLGFFGIWQTQAFADLMEYIQHNDIEIGAFDVQRSSSLYTPFLEKIAQNKGIDSTLYKGLEERFGNISQRLKKNANDSVRMEANELIKDYQSLKLKGFDIWKSLPSKWEKLASRTIENRIAYIQYFIEFSKTQDWHARWAARDSMMAENVIWLTQAIYPEEKVILVAHNFHISKFNKNESTMGETLKAHFKDDYYSIGAFVGEGKYAGNYRNEKIVAPTDSAKLDIKHIIKKQKGFAHFLAAPKALGADASFYFDPCTINDSFIDLNKSNSLTLYRHFDGVILIKSSSLPSYLDSFK